MKLVSTIPMYVITIHQRYRRHTIEIPRYAPIRAYTW